MRCPPPSRAAETFLPARPHAVHQNLAPKRTRDRRASQPRRIAQEALNTHKMLRDRRAQSL